MQYKGCHYSLLLVLIKSGSPVRELIKQLSRLLRGNKQRKAIIWLEKSCRRLKSTQTNSTNSRIRGGLLRSLPALEGVFKMCAMASDQDEAFMRRAIQVMRDAGVVNKTGGPFGALVVKDDQVIAAAGNSVVKDNDPSAHAEVNAIRQACQTLDNWDLSGCVMYSSCECCPMCYSTAYWANIL